MVAINPYKRLPIYTDKFVRSYKGVRLGKLPPHIFAIAETAYNAMIQHNMNQSVLVSGESGAGKQQGFFCDCVVPPCYGRPWLS